jgi:hypothetical protein
LRTRSREEHFRFRREEVTGGWRKLRNEELHGLYSSPDIVRAMKPNANAKDGTFSKKEEAEKPLVRKSERI